jgi:hypothetical protein
MESQMAASPAPGRTSGIARIMAVVLLPFALAHFVS